MRLTISGEYPPHWRAIAQDVKAAAGWRCIRCNHANDLKSGHVLTVHHADGNKSNCAWWNLLALCQRCHLRFQATVDPHVVFVLEHSDWYKPYVAGFYAFKYLKLELTREETVARLDELLALERLA
jgi:transcription elongation factor Elf1